MGATAGQLGDNVGPAGDNLIADSWRRSALAGVDPAGSLVNRPALDVDLDGPLMAAARPVLAELAQSLAGTGFAFILGDRDARVLHRFGDTRFAHTMFEQRSVEIGVGFLEEEVGTNALGTAIEVRRPVYVDGRQHFAEELQVFSCLGYPIIHPLTQRVAGVLDLTGTEGVSHPVIYAMMRRVVRDIEDRLLDASRASERELLASFRAASRRRDRAVVAVGEDVLLANRPALDLLQGNDFAILRSLTPSSPVPEGTRNVAVTLASGRHVALDIAAAGGGALLTLHDRTGSSGSRRAQQEAVLGSGAAGGDSGAPAHGQPRSAAGARAGETSEAYAPGALTLVSGPPGSGRSTCAKELAGTRSLVVVPAHVARESGEAAWLALLREGLAADPEGFVVCLEDVELVPDALLAVAIDGLRDEDRPDVIVVSDTVGDLRGRAAVLASMCTRRIAMAPLSERHDEMHLLAVRMVQDLKPGAELRLTPSVLEALAAHHWPGNFNELRMVLSQVVAHRTTGDVVMSDLPEAYRSTTPGRQLGALERAERDAIVRALASCDGNKVRTAKLLGISRTTLYTRMRQLRVAD